MRRIAGPFCLIGLSALVGACGSGGAEPPATPVKSDPPACVVSDTPTTAGNMIVRVTSLPANQPAADAVFIAGTMNGWKPGDTAWQLKPNCDGSLQVEVPFAKVGDSQQFKFTRGDWKKVEVDANRYDVPNRTLTSDGVHTLAKLTIAKWADLEGGSLGSPPTVTGDVRFQDVEVSPGVTRKLRVYLPPDYATAPAKRYPVLYMFDAQNLYDKKTSGFGKEWQVDETLEAMFKAGQTDGVIVVGIDNAGDAVNRYAEYTGWNWTHPTLGAITARGDQHAAWIVGTVMPLVNSSYRTLTDRANTGLAGSSMGAYMTLYTGAKYPEKFGKLAAFSLVALDDPMQGQHLRDFVAAPGNAFASTTTVYVDVGDAEQLSYTTPALMVSSEGQMCAALQSGGFTPTCKVIAGGIHDETAWSVRLPDILKAWYGK
ncbi:alpha/beta hydrolase-fold protein [Niveibacterium umoris]|uniref:Enterochelin esterase-like enzyme n=1 Tax=Niveibacterium umoris TaxID=1193620 RepID=A0A840BNA6_9RHOO|nr:alpha/beta hydrolase-fold protein [Niveibacterium umoris]MBB4014123.1 enterochelin esterase-like enzyme [Niveibacterium umoris]